MSRPLDSSLGFTFRYVQNWSLPTFSAASPLVWVATVSPCTAVVFLRGLPACVTGPRGLCSSQQPEWSFNNVGQPTCLFRALLLLRVALRVGAKALTHDSARYLSDPLLLFPPFHSNHVASLVLFGCTRPTVASGPLLRLFQASVEILPLAIPEADFLNPLSPQMPSSSWALLWPLFKTSGPPLSSQHHLPYSFYCLPNSLTSCFCLLPDFLSRM